jgi:hypothetical protein
MPLPLLPIILGTVFVGGTVAAVAAKLPRRMLGKPQIMTLDLGGMNLLIDSIRAKTPVVDRIFSSADEFTNSINKSALSPTSPDWKKGAAEAQARYEKEKAEAVAQGRQLIEDWKTDINKGLKTSGIGIVLIPFVIAGAEFVKLGADAMVWLGDALGLYESGWTEAWQAEAERHLAFFVENGIPFPAFEAKYHNSPMGYVQGESGIYGIHAGLNEMGGKLTPSALNAFRTIKRRTFDNPLVQALYLLGSTTVPLAWTGSNLKRGELWRYDTDDYTYGTMPSQRKFFETLVPAIATSVAQDFNIPFARWKEVIEHAWVGWDVGIQGALDSGWHFPSAQAVAVAYDYAVWICGQIRLQASVAAIKPGVLSLIQPLTFTGRS